jgi:ABC-type sugar transport system substrate-binding protein
MLAMIAGPVGASARAVTPKTPKVTRSLVYFIYNGPTPPYFGPMLSGANAVAKYYPNLDIKTLSANASAATEVTQIKEAVAAGAKGIVLNPVDASDTSAAVQAMKAGVPVVTLDRDITSTSGRIAFIGDKDVTLGQEMTTEGLSWLKSHGIKTPWNVVILEGTLGASTAVDRLTGAMDVLKPLIANHTVKVVLNQSADFGTAPAQTLMTEELAKTTNIQLVISGNDAMALGVINAYAAHGLTSALGKTVAIVGADAQPQDMTDIAKGTQLATVTHSPYLEAFWAVEALSNYLTSQTKPSAAKFPHGDVTIPMTIVTKANVSKVAGWGTPSVVPPLPYGKSSSHKS